MAGLETPEMMPAMNSKIVGFSDIKQNFLIEKKSRYTEASDAGIRFTIQELCTIFNINFHYVTEGVAKDSLLGARVRAI